MLQPICRAAFALRLLSDHRLGSAAGEHPRLAGLARVPVNVIEAPALADDHQVMEINLIENLQRED